MDALFSLHLPPCFVLLGICTQGFMHAKHGPLNHTAQPGTWHCDMDTMHDHIRLQLSAGTKANMQIIVCALFGIRDFLFLFFLA